MGKIENQSNDEFETDITVPSQCDQENINGEFLNLDNQRG